jgi:uncharacterized membrane protein
MITVLLDMFTLLMQTISMLTLVYGVLLAFVFAFGRDARRPEVGVTPAQGFRVDLTEWNQ